jgi:hypothetical protein
MILKTLRSKVEHATRLLFINTITRWNGSILVVEYPKSGGTWLGQLISNYLEIPFPRNRFPATTKAVFHGHYRPTGMIKKNKKIVFLVRDGRDVLVSFYYHQLLWNDKNKLNPKDVIYHRKNTGFKDFKDVKGNLKEYLDYIYLHKPSRFQHFTYMGNWYTFNKEWLKAAKELGQEGRIYMIRYEDLLADTAGTMRTMFKDFFKLEVDEKKLQSVVDKFSFENQTKRKKGQEDTKSFLRKGISGDWKNYFEQAERARFKELNGSLLEELGYETSEDW